MHASVLDVEAARVDLLVRRGFGDMHVDDATISDYRGINCFTSREQAPRLVRSKMVICGCYADKRREAHPHD